MKKYRVLFVFTFALKLMVYGQIQLHFDTLVCNESFHYGNLAFRRSFYCINDSNNLIPVSDSIVQQVNNVTKFIGWKHYCPDSVATWRIIENRGELKFTDIVMMPNLNNLKISLGYRNDNSILYMELSQVESKSLSKTDMIASIYFKKNTFLSQNSESTFKVDNSYVSLYFNASNILSSVALYFDDHFGKKYNFNELGACISFGSLYNNFPIDIWNYYYNNGVLQKVELYELKKNNSGKVEIVSKIIAEYSANGELKSQ